jgi:hypothetical protein
MKRHALALCAGLLLVGLLPGATLAIVTPFYVDQSNTVLGDTISGELAQTFTAGQSGPLNQVDLVLGSLNDPGGGSLSMSIFPTDGSGTPVTSGAPLATSAIVSVPYLPDAGAWTSFSFGSPYSVTAGTMYAIVFNAGGGANVWATGSHSDAYARGAAWIHAGSSWTSQTSPDDLDFRTYLEESVTTKVAWDESQVAAGTGTALKLTVTITFGNDGDAGNYVVRLGNLPSWYVNPTPPTIVCSWGACTLATIQGAPGITVTASDPGTTLTVTLHGTATPAVSDEGTPGTAHGNGCISNLETSLCSDGTASVAVVAPAAPTPTPAPTKAATPPPTNSGAGPASDNRGDVIWFLPFALVVSIGGLLFILDQRRRRSI